MPQHKQVYKVIFFALFLFFSLISAGCGGEKGREFLGSWQQITNSKFPSTLNIRYEDGIYHVDLHYFDETHAKEKFSQEVSDFYDGKSKKMPSREASFGKDSYKLKKLEAVAISNSVLQGDGFSLRLEGKNLKFNEDVYEKK